MSGFCPLGPDRCVLCYWCIAPRENSFTPPNCECLGDWLCTPCAIAWELESEGYSDLDEPPSDIDEETEEEEDPEVWTEEEPEAEPPVAEEQPEAEPPAAEEDSEDSDCVLVSCSICNKRQRTQ